MPQGQVVFLGFPLSFWSEVENLSEKGDNVVASGLLGLPTGLFRGLDLRFKPSLGESVSFSRLMEFLQVLSDDVLPIVTVNDPWGCAWVLARKTAAAKSALPQIICYIVVLKVLKLSTKKM